MVGGERVEVLNGPARVLHVVLHAAQHGLQEPKPREDLRRALERVPEETWADARRWPSRSMRRQPSGRDSAWSPPAASCHPGSSSSRARLGPRRSCAPRPRPDGSRAAPARRDTGSRRQAKADLAGGLSVLCRTYGRGRRSRDGPGGLALAHLWRPIWILIRLGPRSRRSCGRGGRRGGDGFGDGTAPPVEVEGDDRDEVLQRLLRVVNGLTRRVSHACPGGPSSPLRTPSTRRESSLPAGR